MKLKEALERKAVTFEETSINEAVQELTLYFSCPTDLIRDNLDRFNLEGNSQGDVIGSDLQLIFATSNISDVSADNLSAVRIGPAVMTEDGNIETTDLEDYGYTAEDVANLISLVER